jgi:hypothetical protein
VASGIVESLKVITTRASYADRALRHNSRKNPDILSSNLGTLATASAAWLIMPKNEAGIITPGNVP